MTTGGDNFRAPFEALFRAYYRRLVGYLMHKYDVSVDDARDVAQETFLRVFMNMAALRGGADWAYIRTTADHLMYNRFRDGGTQKRSATIVPIEDVLDPPNAERDVETTLVVSEQTAIFRKRYRDAIAALSQPLRECFLLRERGYSYADIAKVLRIEENTVKSRLHAAKDRLHADLGEVPQGIDWPEAAGGADDREE